MLHILTPHFPFTLEHCVLALRIKETELLVYRRPQTRMRELIEQVLVHLVLLACEEHLCLIQVDPSLQEVIVISPGLQDLKPDAGNVAESISSEGLLVG